MQPNATGTTPPGWGAPTSVAASTKGADLAALSSFKIAAIISIVSSALGYTYPLFSSLGGGYSFSVPMGGSTTSLTNAAVSTFFGIVIVGLAIAIVSYLFLRSGFARLRAVDGRFASTPTFAIVAIVGLVMVAAGLGVFLGWLLQLLSCAGSLSTIPSSCVNLGTLLGGVALLGIGGIILLVGVIGTVVGIWRLGDRYNDVLFKVGAILLIFFGFVGAILLLIGVVRAERNVRAAPDVSAPQFSSPPPPGAPLPPR